MLGYQTGIFYKDDKYVDPPEGYPEDYLNQKDYTDPFTNFLNRWWAIIPDGLIRYKEIFSKLEKPKEAYNYLPNKVLLLVSYIDYIADTQISNSKFVDIILEKYKYYTSYTGAQKLGFEVFTRLVVDLFEYKKVEEKYKLKVNELIAKIRAMNVNIFPTEETMKIDSLLEIISNWQELLPPIEGYSEIKNENPDYFLYDYEHKFSNICPIDFSGRIVLHSEEEIAEILIHLTKIVLQEIDSTFFVIENKEEIIYKSYENVKVWEHYLTQKKLLMELGQTEKECYKILKKWLNNEKKFLKKNIKKNSNNSNNNTKEIKYFELNHLISDDALKDFHNQLYNLNCFKKDQSFAKFRKLFLGKAPKYPFIWSGYFGDLCTIISILVDSEIIISPKTHYWKTVQAIFLNKNKEEFPLQKFEGWKPTKKNEKAIIRYTKELEDSMV